MVNEGSGVSIHDAVMRFKPDGLSPNGWAVRAGVSRTVWADMKRHGNPSRRTLDKLLAIAGSSLAEFEALRIGDSTIESEEQDRVGAVGDHRASSWRGAPLAPIPVIWSAVSKARWGEGAIGCLILDREQRISSLARPLSLTADQNAFAITMPDGSMWPRFRLGRQIIASGLAPVAIGDDVLVTLRPALDRRMLAIVGELVRRSADAVELRQFNPQQIIRLEVADIDAITKIVGEAY